MTIELITQIEINVGSRNFSGCAAFDTAAPTSSAYTTIDSGLNAISRR